MDNKTMGRLIAARRKHLGMTQKQLADQLGVTDRAVSRWERGVGAPEISLLPPLAASLELTTDELLGNPPPAEEPNAPTYTPTKIGIPLFYHYLLMVVLGVGYAVILLGIIFGSCMRSLPVQISLMSTGFIIMIAAIILSLVLYRCPVCGHTLSRFRPRLSQYTLQYCHICGQRLYSDKSIRTLKEYRTYKKAR